MSVGCFDKNNSGELIGITVAKDLTFIPEGVEEKYMKNQNFIFPIICLE